MLMILWLEAASYNGWIVSMKLEAIKKALLPTSVVRNAFYLKRNIKL